MNFVPMEVSKRINSFLNSEERRFKTGDKRKGRLKERGRAHPV